jgi:hypothetical protein
VPPISQCLRDLDRRVLGEQNLSTVEGWTKAVSRWRWTLGVSIFLSVVTLPLELLGDSRLSPFVVLPMIVSLAFRAGGMKAEHDRILGVDQVMGRTRPAGLSNN